MKQDSLFESGPLTACLQGWHPAQWPLDATWQPTVNAWLASAAGVACASHVRQRLRDGATVYPPEPFRALALTPLSAVKVVILGQDPYHGPGQAQGLAFSVSQGVRVPPSLRNIFRELQRDSLIASLPGHGSLVAWAKRGVLLLNTSFTVEQGLAASHAKIGWGALTDALLAQVAATVPACAYLLWGAHAQAKAPAIVEASARHGRQALVLQANHPSPLAALRPPVPFIGCGHFGQSARWLAERGVAFDWALGD
ncbi:MAG: hypothetical protein RLZZ401_1370 [Pseudomonadota bacterium]